MQKLKSRKLELELQRLEHLISPPKEPAMTPLKPITIWPTRQIVNTADVEEAEILDPVVLLRVDKSFRLGMTQEELYEATRGDWALTPKKRPVRVRYAMAIVSFVIREVYVINDWHSVPMSSWGPGRWRFDGTVAQDKANLIGKSVYRYINGRATQPAKYVNC